jgi:hypothetical protein
MKTTAKRPPLSSSPLTGIPARLQAIEEACGFEAPLPDESRKVAQELVWRVQGGIVERIIVLAARGEGSVAGIAFDPDAAKAALAEAEEAEEIAAAAKMLMRRAQDHAVRLRKGVATNALAIKMALRGYTKTAQGASLLQENDELRALARAHLTARKAAKTRAKNAAGAAEITPPESPDV